jgi:hypothetical protein
MYPSYVVEPYVHVLYRFLQAQVSSLHFLEILRKISIPYFYSERELHLRITSLRSFSKFCIYHSEGCSFSKVCQAFD